MSAVRVLLVDDSPDVRGLLRTRIGLEGGYEIVDEAADGAEAIALATKHQPDLVILDAMMPRMGGQAAAAHMLELRPDLKLVFLSGYSSSELDQAFLVRHRLTVLIKPIAPAELVSVVRDHLADRAENVGKLASTEQRASSG
jgi:CheY-like chemotaxis protein